LILLQRDLNFYYLRFWLYESRKCSRLAVGLQSKCSLSAAGVQFYRSRRAVLLITNGAFAKVLANPPFVLSTPCYMKKRLVPSCAARNLAASADVE
jgi:hypothetical protein